jgi:hypothetical protein
LPVSVNWTVEPSSRTTDLFQKTWKRLNYSLSD